jgi:hypothetical protein
VPARTEVFASTTFCLPKNQVKSFGICGKKLGTTSTHRQETTSMPSAGAVGASVGVVIVLVVAACSNGGDPSRTSGSVLAPSSVSQVRVERGGGGDGVVGEDVPITGTYTLEAHGSISTGSYSGGVDLNFPTFVHISVNEPIRISDTAMFSISTFSLNTTATTAGISLSFSPNLRSGINGAHTQLNQAFQATTDISCQSGTRHTFILTGPLPQLGQTTLTFSHCAPIL